MAKIRIRQFQLFLAAILACVVSVSGQSTDQRFPTAVSTNEIAGTIRARDIGDPRLTTYFYEFGGGQGDIFINVVSRNFDGDIDVFTVDGLKPLSKIVIYADAGGSETGRIVYLRKFEKLLLRVQGRSPNDDPATIRIKFGGSFVASKSAGRSDDVQAPEISRGNPGGVRVNSVGTIVGSQPVRKTETDVKSGKTTSGAKPVASSRTTTPADAAADPLANIRLIILFKNGNKFERPMSEILRFTVDKGILLVFPKKGDIGRYLLLDIAKITVE